MSNYSTSYNISQTGDLYLLGQHSVATGQAKYGGNRGTTINAPVNYRKLKLFTGLDNEFFFYIKNQDRKPVLAHNMEIHGSLVNRETGGVLVKQKLALLDPTQGLVRMEIRANDIYGEHGNVCDLVLTYTNDRGLELPLFSDLNMRPSLVVEITDEAQPVPLTTQVDDTAYEIDGIFYGSIMAGPTYYGKKNGLVTFGVYTTGYTGKFWLEGSTSNQPASGDWFEIELGVQNFYHSFRNFTGIEPFVFQSNIQWFRPKWENTGNGTIDKTIIRL